MDIFLLISAIAQRIYWIVYLKLPEELWLSAVLTTSLHPDATCLSSFLFLVLNSTFPVYFSRICATQSCPCGPEFEISLLPLTKHFYNTQQAPLFQIFPLSSPLLLYFSEFHIAQFHNSWWHTLPIPHLPYLQAFSARLHCFHNLTTGKL